MGLAPVNDDGKCDPIMIVEQRPSSLTGHSWWLVLSYSTAEFEEMLPFEFPSLSETDQSLVIAPIAERLRLKMKEVLDAEDLAGVPPGEAPASLPAPDDVGSAVRRDDDRDAVPE